MTHERLAELRSKVEHGFNLINSEALEVLKHFGVAVEQRKRCDACYGDPVGYKCYTGFNCCKCNGSGYEVRK